MKKMEQLAAVVEILAVHHPRGLRIMLGDLPPLSSEQWHDFLESLKGSSDKLNIQSDSNLEDHVLYEITRVDDVLSLIDEAGGWEAIVDSVKHYRKNNPRDWDIFVRYIHVLNCPFKSSMGMGYSVDDICKTYHVDRKTVSRRRYTVPNVIAYDALFGVDLVLSR